VTAATVLRKKKEMRQPAGNHPGWLDQDVGTKLWDRVTERRQRH
jgi:hypothetical protein